MASAERSRAGWEETVGSFSVAGGIVAGIIGALGRPEFLVAGVTAIALGLYFKSK